MLRWFVTEGSGTSQPLSPHLEGVEDTGPLCAGVSISLRTLLPPLQLQSLPSRRLRGCHNLWSPGTTEALPAPSQADSRVRVSQGADGRTKEGCRLTLVGTPGSRRNIRIQVSAFLILFNRIQTVSGEIFFPLPDRF